MASYTGKFTFINKDGENFNRSEGEDFVVLSHVSKAYRRWSKEQRNKQLRSSNINPAQLFQRDPGPAAGLKEQTHKPSSSATNRHGQFQDTDNNAGAKSCKQHRLRKLAPTPSSSPLTLLNRGNSDPFNVAAMDVTPATNELLCLASEFYVFWAWPINASGIFMRKAKEDWMKEVRDSLSHEAHFHVILAKGTYVKERPPAMIKAADVERGLVHKMRAMSALRKSIAEADPSAAGALLMTMLRLLAIEFYVGNFQAAAMHHQAAKQFIFSHKFPGWHDPATFAIADVWVATALLRKPALSPASWDPGSWSSQPESTSAPKRENFSATLDVGIPTFLRKIFCSIREVVTIKKQLEGFTENERFRVVGWVDARSAAIKATVLEYFIDFTASRPEVPEKTDELVTSSCMLAVILFVTMDFLFSDESRENKPPKQLMPSNVIHASLERFRKYLTRLLQLADQRPNPDTCGMLTWLVFIGAFGSEIGFGPSASVDLRQAFLRLCSERSLLSQQAARQALSCFLYDANIMDPFLSTLLEK